MRHNLMTLPCRGRMLVENEMQYSIDPGGVECETERYFKLIDRIIDWEYQNIYDPSGVEIIDHIFFYQYVTPLGSANCWCKV